MAKAAERAGFDSIAVPDSVFYPESVSADYPFTSSGERWWDPTTPFLDPFVAISAMAAATERITFLTNVFKLPLRSPLLVAKQVASIAALSSDRFRLGVGISWIPEEFAWTGTDMRTRGARTDEAIEIIRRVCSGREEPDWVSYSGHHYRFDNLVISPSGRSPLRILAGGHSDMAMKRAARNDGWISANTTEENLGELVPRLLQHLQDSERDPGEGFEVNALAVDVFDAEGFRRLAELGVTECQVAPWYYYGGDPNDLGVQLESLERFADTVIQKLNSES